jgi:hypothetical protein
MGMNSDPNMGERLGRIILEPAIQTRISSFLISIKQVNALILFQIESQQRAWAPYALFHNQLSREVEMIGLLQRVTDWSMNPSVYFNAGISNLRHLCGLQFFRFLPVNLAMDPLCLYRYLALTHALYAHLRFIPLLPLELPLEHQYLAFLRTLETVHGRQMQAQIAMLRQLPVSLSERERETVVGEENRRVREVFQKFVEEIAEG